MAGRNEIKEVLSNFKGEIFYDEQMSRHTSLCVGGPVDALVVIENEDQLAAIVEDLRKQKINYQALGNLTNVIVRDGGYRGVIILMKGLNKISCERMKDGGCSLRAGAGAALSKLVGEALQNELTGLEFCAGIPGSVGGALWMNAGAYGKEMKDVVSGISLLTANGKKVNMRKQDISFVYRRTILPADSIILSGEFKLEKGVSGQIKEKMGEIMRLRQDKHPLQYPNAGSIFKNIPGMPAGQIIEELGLKGTRRGDAQISLKHANFIVNKGRATAADIQALIDLVQDTVKKEKGINLETEVVIIGEN
jgi:UDP-N-acetylmuramate dehydrogenase